MSLTVSAQTNNVIILWDVTWSMKGLTGTNPVTGEAIIDSTKDIWKPTKNTIIETIEKLPLDGSYNVKIIPFEDPNNITGFPHEIKDIRSLDSIELLDLIDWVRKYDGSPFPLRKGTNVCQALENVFSSIGNQQNYKVYNQILLLSDGGQSARNSGFNNETPIFTEAFFTGDNNNRNKFLNVAKSLRILMASPPVSIKVKYNFLNRCFIIF